METWLFYECYESVFICHKDLTAVVAYVGAAFELELVQSKD